MADPRALSDSFQNALDGSRILQEVIPDLVLSLDSKGIVLSYFSQRNDDESSPGDLLGKPLSEVFSPEAWAGISRATEIARITRKPQSAFFEARTRSGPRLYEAQIHLRLSGNSTVLVRDLSATGRGETLARHQAEAARDAAQREADLFRRLFNSANVLSGIFSLNGLVLEVNATFLLACGYSSDDVRALPVIDLLHPDDRAGASARLSEVASGHAVQGFEARLLRRDYSSFWASINACRDPQFDAIYLIATDISERKLREQIAQDRLRMMGMAEAMGDIGFWRIEVRSLEVDWSPQVYRIHGTSPDLFVPSLAGWFGLVLPEDRPAVLQHLHRIIHEDEPSQLELRLLPQGGPARRVVLSGRRAIDQAGNITHLFGALQDVTRQRSSEVELRRLAAVANLTLNGVIITNPQGEIEWVNASFEQLTGYPLHEVIGKRPGPLLQGPETNRQVVDFARSRILRREGFKIELLNYRKSGQKYWVEIEVQPFFNEAGELIHFIGVENDISERKLAEAQLIAAREAAIEGSRVKSQFLANMSHEIRTPLNGVLGAARLLSSTSLSTEQRELLEAIVFSGTSLLATINDILDLSKIEAGKLELELVPFSPSLAIEEIVRSFSPLAVAKDLALSCLAPPSLPAWVLGDPVRFRQIFNNLISNAIKFTSRGSIDVGLAHEGGQLVGSVRDTGIGILPERRSVIFEPFTQADGSTTRNFGGTGLGLSICRELVWRMGGRIWFESAPGLGSTFFFSVPFPEASPPTPAPAPPERRPAPRRALRVLVVEDNPVNAFIVEKMLRKMGHQSQVVGNGRLALDTLATSAWDVVLMDVQMPVMDGLEATRLLRSRGERVPVIMLTANAMKGDAEMCLGAGANAYLSKPVDLEALSNLLVQICP